VIEMARSDNKTLGAVDVAAGPASGDIDIRGYSAARGQMLSLKLDRMADSVGGQTVVDPTGYLTSLGGVGGGAGTGAGAASVGGVADADIADLRKARLMLQSVTVTNPKHGPGWIALARLEEQAKNLPVARKLIRDGCEHCPRDEDVWLEAARLQLRSQGARAVLSEAVRRNPQSVKLWLRAAELEADNADAKKAVLRKALTLVPNSEKLWKAAVSLEQPADARILLGRAVELVPGSLDLWLALARLETYGNAQKVLNQARTALPAEPQVWIAAARLEESQGKTDLLPKILQRALKSLAKQGLPVDREAWTRYAEDAERAGAPATAAAIVEATRDVGVDEVDRLRTWSADADALEGRGAVACARAMHASLLECFPEDDGLWMQAALVEKRRGTSDRVIAILRRAVAAVPQGEVLWLMAAKEKWVQQGDVAGARELLRDAFAANANSERIWLAAVKLEWENKETDRARALLDRARALAPGPAVWMKSALLERDAGVLTNEEKLLLEGVSKFPAYPRLWMMLGQLYERTDLLDKAREAFGAGLRHNPDSIPLWQLAARSEERRSGATKARLLLEAGRLRNPNNPELLLESIRLERRTGNEKIAATLTAKALQDCPKSGILRAEDILTAPRPDQKRKSAEALKHCDTDAHVVLAVALLFWQDRKFDKARKWLHRACALDPDLGDAWVAYTAFEDLHGDEASRADVVARFMQADPAHGEKWQAIAKRPQHRGMSKVQILKLAVEEMRAADAHAVVKLFDHKPMHLSMGTGLDQPGPSGAVAVASSSQSVATPSSASVAPGPTA
jgi:pre-mRNA-processing factor 6